MALRLMQAAEQTSNKHQKAPITRGPFLVDKIQKDAIIII